MAEQWEYHVETIHNTQFGDLPHTLNYRGADGWELVSMVSRIKPALGELTGGDVTAVFKRPGRGSWDPARIYDPSADDGYHGA